jgi:hypothetical protein
MVLFLISTLNDSNAQLDACYSNTHLEETVLEVLFLQEKNLWTSKEGSMDFNPESSNRMVVEWMERMDADEDNGGEEGGREGWREDDGELRRVEGGD